MTNRFVAAFAALSLAGTAAAPAMAKKADPEMILHIEASAQVAPDKVLLPLKLAALGDTNSHAEAGLTKQETDVRRQLSTLGIDTSRITPDASTSFANQPGICSAEAAAEAAVAMAEPAPRADKRRKSSAAARSDNCSPEMVEASRTLLIEVDGLETVDRVLKSPLAELVGSGRRSIVFSQSDPLAARKKARDEALAKARTEADGYAEALGYRVVRIERVSNARPAMSMNDLIGFVATIEDRGSRMQPGWFAAAITENVAIDFVIVPR